MKNPCILDQNQMQKLVLTLHCNYNCVLSKLLSKGYKLDPLNPLYKSLGCSTTPQKLDVVVGERKPYEYDTRS